MESDAQDWERFTRPGFLLRFSYPVVTPQGQSVERSDEPFRGYARVHLSSADRRELYLEVVRFHDLGPEAEYRRHRPYLEQRFGANAVTALSETRLREWSGWAYGFRWDEEGHSMERSALLLELAGATYRIIYDPRSELNAQVIATFTITD